MPPLIASLLICAVLKGIMKVHRPPSSDALSQSKRRLSLVLLAAALLTSWLVQGAALHVIYIVAVLGALGLLWWAAVMRCGVAWASLASLSLLVVLSLLGSGLTVGAAGRVLFRIPGAEVPWFVEAIFPVMLIVAGIVFLVSISRGTRRILVSILVGSFAAGHWGSRWPGVGDSVAVTLSATAFLSLLVLVTLLATLPVGSLGIEE